MMKSVLANVRRLIVVVVCISELLASFASASLARADTIFVLIPGAVGRATTVTRPPASGFTVAQSQCTMPASFEHEPRVVVTETKLIPAGKMFVILTPV